MDAIQLIERDHREVERLFKSFEQAERRGRADEQRRVVRALVRELSVHAALEEQHVYPALREAGAEPEVLAALEEHHAAKVTLDELDALPAGHERLAGKVKVLATAVRAHVAEEERDVLPRLARLLGPDRLRALGETLEQARTSAPTRPHPLAPDTPPANWFTDAAAALVDRTRDAVRDGVPGLVAAVGRAFRQGLGAARGAATRVQEAGREAADRARETSREWAQKAEEASAEVVATAAEATGEAARAAGDRGARTLSRASARTVRASRRARGKARASARKARRSGKGGGLRVVR
jgi:hemerythrin superfamily protein